MAWDLHRYNGYDLDDRSSSIKHPSVLDSTKVSRCLSVPVGSLISDFGSLITG